MRRTPPGLCARTGSDHMPGTLLSNAINSRRLIGPSQVGSRIVAGQTGRLEVARFAPMRAMPSVLGQNLTVRNILLTSAVLRKQRCWRVSRPVILKCGPRNPLHHDLRADLDHAFGRNVKELA